jgi:tetratricopeptide (TPR) repeat protein
VAGDFLTLLLGTDIPYGAALVLAGQMAAGIRWIEASIQRFAAWGNATQPATGHMILGEIYLQMALGKKEPPLRVILRNLGFVLRTLPLASYKARRHLEEAVRRARHVGMPGILARSLLDLGLLYAAKKRWEEARTSLEQALQLAESLASSALREKIQQTLASLDDRHNG